MLCFSGGTSITVMGVGLDLIQKPQFFVTYGGQFFTSVSASSLCSAEKAMRRLNPWLIDGCISFFFFYPP